MNIQEALMNMDALDDDQWTGDGAPKVDIVSEAVGKKVSRQDIIDVAPEFSRTNMAVKSNEPKSEEATVEEGEAEEVSLKPLEDYLEGDPLTEPEFITFLLGLDVQLLEPLERILIEQQSEAESVMSRAEDLKNRIKRSLMFTRNRVKNEVPDMSNQQAIQKFIASQTTTRNDQVIKTRELLKDIDIKTLDPRSAIDRAMSRKTGRGGSRPTRGMMKG